MTFAITLPLFPTYSSLPCPLTQRDNVIRSATNDATIHNHAAITITTVVALQLRQATSTVLPTVARV